MYYNLLISVVNIAIIIVMVSSIAIWKVRTGKQLQLSSDWLVAYFPLMVFTINFAIHLISKLFIDLFELNWQVYADSQFGHPLTIYVTFGLWLLFCISRLIFENYSEDDTII